MARRPNVILINCDDMGYGDLGCYGSAVNDSPTVDALAAGGLRMTQFYAASPVCSPSRCSLMTGCYPPRVQVNRVLFPGEGMGLNPQEYTLGRMFHDAGYATAIIGKWHCGDQEAFLPGRFGFDEYFGLPYSNDMGVQAGRPNTDRFPPLPLVEQDEVVQQQPDQRALTERYVARAQRFIRRSAARPFFLYLAHMHVHLPLYAAERFVRQSRNGDFGACVASVDWSAACLLDQVRALGLEGDTLFIFTSDNGSRGDHGASNAPLRGAKHSTWEGGMRVPCVFYWPGHIAPGRVCDGMMSNLDLLPTLAHLAGQPLPGDRVIDGLDLTETLLAGAPSPRHTLAYFKAHDDNTTALEAVRQDGYKLFLSREGRPVWELYDLSADPHEDRNLYGELPGVAAALTELHGRIARELGDTVTGQAEQGVRPCGRVANPRPMTQYDANHPYIIAMYDKPDAG